jgi:hypothetical protein
MYMLKSNESHMNAIHVQMTNQQDLMWMFPLLWTLIKCMHIDIITHRNNMCTQMAHKILIHTHTFKKNKNQWLLGNEKQFNVDFVLIENLLSFKNHLHWKYFHKKMFCS